MPLQQDKAAATREPKKDFEKHNKDQNQGTSALSLFTLSVFTKRKEYSTMASKKKASIADMDDEQVADLKEAFAMFDINGDGELPGPLL